MVISFAYIFLVVVTTVCTTLAFIEWVLHSFIVFFNILCLTYDNVS